MPSLWNPTTEPIVTTEPRERMNDRHRETGINWPAVGLVVVAVVIDALVVGGLFGLAYGVRWLLERAS